MKFSSSHNYTLTLKDGSQIDCPGSTSGVEKSELKDDLEWLDFHIKTELIARKLSHSDIHKVRIDITYNDPTLIQNG